MPSLLDRVTSGDEITITRHGRPVAVLVRPDALRIRRAEAATEAADDLRRQLERARRIRLDDAPTLSQPQADALVAAVRASRRAR